MKKFLVILMILAMTSFIFVGCLPTTNTGPVFTSTPGTTATVGTAYSYTPTATDADADTVTFVVAGPTGMAISAGVITWTPTTAQIGTHDVVVTASDGTDATAQTVTITVSAAGAVTGTIISIAAIPGVTAPAYGVAPDTAITATTQYTGTIAWKTAAGAAAGATFAAETVYVATITLTAKTGFTLTGVTANFFTVADAEGVSNPADSGVATATFAKTDVAGTAVVVSTKTIAGVTLPVTGATPVTKVTAIAQYTGTVTWKTIAGVVPTTFAAGKVYVATITLTALAPYTLTGILADAFSTTTASTCTNPADSGVVTAVFAATFTVPKVVSAVFTDSDTITITYNVKVTSTIADYNVTATGINMVYPGASVLTPNQVTGSGSKFISITFTSATGVYAVNTSTGTIDIAATVVDATTGVALVAETYDIVAGGF